MISRVLVAVDDLSLQRKIREHLSAPDVLVSVPRGRARLWQRISAETCDLVVLSSSYIPEPVTSMVEVLRELPDAPALVVVSRSTNGEERAALVAAGAEEVLDAGLKFASISRLIDSILSKRREQIERTLGASREVAQPRLTDFVSNSPEMQDFMDIVRRVVQVNSSLLIQGETGVGKEWLARAIHAEGPRSEGSFIAINCGALPESLIESELFGHEKGAFTGAMRARRGCFEMAHCGTIFLDEVSEMPLHVQVRLLRVLQDKVIQRIGAERSIAVDVRLMAATNRDLQQDVDAGRFRKDLYYRLGVVTVTVPPLRDRREDISNLVYRYIDYLRPQVGRDVDSIEQKALEAMERYDWPGNIRELINVVERAILLCNGSLITINDLPLGVYDKQKGLTVNSLGQVGILGDLRLSDEVLSAPLSGIRRQVVSVVERVYLEEVLRETGGRVGKTAERAGITPRALNGKMRRYGLRKEDFKPASTVNHHREDL